MPDLDPQQRPRVLYVERRYGSQQDQFTERIADILRRGHEVDLGFDLGEWVLNRLDEARVSRPYAALVTHSPNDPGRPSYSGALTVLFEIRRLVDMPVIAYTGAGGLVLVEIGERVDVLIKKSMDADHDGQLILSSLATLIARYRDRTEPPPPRPVVQEGSTVVDATVNLMGGIGVMASHQIAQESCGHPGAVRLCRTDGQAQAESQEVDCKFMTHLLVQVLPDGAMVRFQIEGEDPAAQRLARRLYAAVTSRYAFDIRWDRWE